MVSNVPPITSFPFGCKTMLSTDPSEAAPLNVESSVPFGFNLRTLGAPLKPR